MKSITFGISILAGILVLSALLALGRDSGSATVTEANFEKEAKSFSSHAPIYIDGNAGFTQPDPVNGGGTGTASDPYIIENWDINASSANGIEIRNTNVYFIIRGCYVYGGGSNWHVGIHFYNVAAGKIDSATFYNNSYGIWLEDSLCNDVVNCYSYNNWDGVLLCNSSNNNITNWTSYLNSANGIELYHSSSNNRITNCASYNNSCDGIRLDDSSNNNIINPCNIYNNSEYGFRLSYSSNNSITNCAVYNNSWSGIYLWYSSNTEIHYNNIYNNTDYGICNYNSEIEYQANATYNWWGSANGPGQDGANPVTSNVIYGPWLTEPWEEVTGPVHNLDKDTYYDIIQEGIDDADSGNTLSISAQNYIENINLNKEIKFIGEAWLSGDLIIQSSGVLTLDGFILKMNCTFDGEYKIEVQNGGRLDAINGSVITSYNSAYNYYFSFLSGSVGNLLNSTIEEAGPSGIYIRGIEIYSNSVLINRCTIRNGYFAGILCSQSSPIITNNTIVNNGNYGIFCWWYSSPYIANNTFTNHSQHGIQCQQHSSPMIAYNRFFDNYGGGIVCGTDSNPSIIGNEIVNNFLGVWCHGYSSALIQENIITNNSWRGIYLASSSYLTITKNTLQNNGCGIYLESCNNIFVHYNNFINNTDQCYDDGANYWDSGTEGNYWDDYTGSDSDDDGIGDTPYSILGGPNQDNYPLMLPWPWPIHNINKDTYYTTIQKAIDDADSGNTIQVSAGTYYENVIINKTITLIGEDRNTTIIDGNGTGDVIYISADWVNVSKFKVVSSFYGEVGLYLNIAHCCTITNCNISQNRWGVRLISSHNNAFINCTISSNYQEGIYFYNSTNNTLLNCSVLQNGDCGVYFQDSSYNTIKDCEIFLNKWHGIYFVSTTQNTLLNNKLWGNEINIDIYGYKKTDFNHTISISNVINGKSIYYYYDLHNAIIENLNTTYITIAGCTNVYVQNCSVVGGDSLSLCYVNNVTIDSCNLSNNYYGIMLRDAMNITIANCSTYYNYYDGIIAYSSSNTFITICKVSWNNRFGICLWGSNDFTITSCDISKNNVGIYLWGWGTNNNLILNNILYLNSNNGIALEFHSDSNYIHHNNFINNTNNVYDECTNYWDHNGEGNYWSDYDGVDANGDGIGDTPYNILGGMNKDSYPFMNPIEREPPTVVLTAPLNGAVNVEIDTTIQITFNEPINKLTVQGNITIEPYVGIKNYSWNNGNKTLTLTLLSNLSYYTNYIVTLNTNIKDLSGNRLENIYRSSFRTKEITPPEISNIQAIPATQEIYSYVNITVFISDNAMVNLVCVNIKHPNGTLLGNFSMEGINLDANRNGTYWYGIACSVLGTYSYYIWANDTSGNGNTSALHNFTIQDTTKPLISNVQAYPSVQPQNGWVSISCTVTDNLEVNIVKVNISGPTGFTPVNITMIRIPYTDNYFYYSTYPIAGTYTYCIWVNDTSSNENKSTEYYFTITLTVTTIVGGKEINITGVGTGTVNVTSVAPPQARPEYLQYIGICVNVSITGTLTYANITIRYNDSDVAGIDESKLKMYYWDETENKWELCNNTGVDVDKNTVWANITHLTIFAPMAEKVGVEAVPVLPYVWLLYVAVAIVIVALITGISLKIVSRRKPKEEPKPEVPPPQKEIFEKRYPEVITCDYCNQPIVVPKERPPVVRCHICGKKITLK